MFSRILCFFFVSLFVSAFSLCSKSVLAQDPPKSGSVSKLPDVEVTQKKVEAINEGVENFKELFGKLKELGDPAVRKDNESDAQYLIRAERILKGRALYIHFVHQELQRIIEARYGAEMVLDDYDRWVKTRVDALKLSAAKLDDRAQKIQSDLAEFSFDAVVLAKLIGDDSDFKKKVELEKVLIQKEKDMMLNPPPEKVGFRNLFKSVESDLGPDNARLKKINDFQARSEKFKSLSTDDKIKKYMDFKKKYKDFSFEFSYLTKAVVPENQKLSVSLPKAHESLVSNVKASLSSNKAFFDQLDDQAVQLSIVARYTRENLGLVSSIKDRSEAFETLVQINNKEKSIKDTMTKFLSLPGQLSDDFVGQSLNGGVGEFIDQLKPEQK